MSSCREIKPLLYLHRDGELSAVDAQRVAEHVTSCAACRAILEDLRAMDASMAPFRVEESAEAPPVGEVMHRVLAVRAVEHPQAAHPVMRFFLLGLRAAAAVLIVLFTVQQMRDMGKVAALETRLAMEGMKAPAAGARVIAAGREEELALRQVSRASDPTSFIGSGLASMFRQNEGMFEELAHRYPELATISLRDGLDNRERAILATEGKALRKDIDELLKKGER